MSCEEFLTWTEVYNRFGRGFIHSLKGIENDLIIYKTRNKCTYSVLHMPDTEQHILNGHSYTKSIKKPQTHINKLDWLCWGNKEEFWGVQSE